MTPLLDTYYTARDLNGLDGFVLSPEGRLLNLQAGFAVPVGPSFPCIEEALATSPMGPIGCWRDELVCWEHQELNL